MTHKDIEDEEVFSDAEMIRLKAEERLRKKKLKEDNKVFETDGRKLLHELQVHQIELEMQNDVLRLANDKAEAALKKYTMLYDFAPIGFMTLDSDCSISDLNFTAAEILGDKRFSLINSNFRLFVSDEAKPVFNVFFERVYASNAKESCEVMLGYDNVPLGQVYIEGIVTGDERSCLLSVLDISNFRK